MVATGAAHGGGRVLDPQGAQISHMHGMAHQTKSLLNL